MITIKLDNYHCSDYDFVLNKQNQYSYAFRKLFKNIDLINDKTFLEKIRINHKLSAYEINCLKMDVKTKFEQVKTNKQKLSDEIIEIQEELNKLRNKEIKSKKDIRIIFKLDKKLDYKNRNLSKDITFGGRGLLKQISYLSNDKIKNQETLKQKISEYHKNRILPINYVGSLNDPNGNRYFNFDFDNSTIIYKPNGKTKIEIKYKVNGQYKKILSQLQEVKDAKLLPISIKLTTKNTFITFENELLTNYAFDKDGYADELKQLDYVDSEIKKTIAKKYFREQETRMLVNKVKDRYCAIDLNPEYIGLTIIDKKGFKVIHKQTFDLSKLMIKSNKESSDEDSKYLTNKRKFEIGKVYKYIFDLVNHYKCSNFVIEDLNFKPKTINDKPKEFNRKVKNIWNLNYQLNLIKKHCVNGGIKLIEVNPTYSSFIGNILYNDFDAVNASIEICRRGIEKYIKGNSLYPTINGTIIDTVIERFGESFSDVQGVKDCDSWKKLYELLSETGCKYRWQLNDEFNCFSLSNKKSNVNILIK